ncbi:MAG: hypothetical protein IJ298_06100 [Ruminococcus sp.]|nr:hypothetical protein [Ruminococcus sp.]
MNFLGFEGGEAVKAQLDSMEKSRRMPHAIIVTGGSDSTREAFAMLLCKWAVCASDGERPCGECSGCHKAEGKNHIDIYYAKGSGKTDGISVEEIRNITRDTAIMPHEAHRKVYVLFNADRRMGNESMNAFLKTLEEPMQDILFILTAENIKAVPQTILSRCTCLTLDSVSEVPQEIKDIAREILLSIIASTELPLLKATSALSTRQVALEVLPVIREVLCDALSVSVGAKPLFDEELAVQLRQRLTKSKIIRLIDVTSDAINKTNRNVSLVLISTWLCGEYRRISWQM